MSRPLAYIAGRFGRIGLVQMDTGLAMHVHHHIHLIAKAGGADTLFHVRGQPLPVTDTHAVLVDAWAPHGWRHDRSAGPTTFLTFYLEPAWVADRLDITLAGHAVLPAGPEVMLDDGARRSLADLSALLASVGAGSAAAAADDLIAVLLASILSGPARRPGGLPERPRALDHRIRRAFGLLRDGAGADVAAVAREVGLSRPRFFELFRDGTGLTPACVANAGRMERAIHGLTHSRQPLSGLALDLGYAAQGNFTRFFKQQIGIGPASYRRAALAVGG